MPHAVVCFAIFAVALTIAGALLMAGGGTGGRSIVQQIPRGCSETIYREVNECDRHIWCTELQRTAAIDYTSLVRLMNASADSRPALFQALDYRYFDDCHIPGSVNLWGTLLSCETTAASETNKVKFTGLTQNSEVDPAN